MERTTSKREIRLQEGPKGREGDRLYEHLGSALPSFIARSVFNWKVWQRRLAYNPHGPEGTKQR